MDWSTEGARDQPLIVPVGLLPDDLSQTVSSDERRMVRTELPSSRTQHLRRPCFHQPASTYPSAVFQGLVCTRSPRSLVRGFSSSYSTLRADEAATHDRPKHSSKFVLERKPIPGLAAMDKIRL
jgi:hypothetical protein